MSKTDPRILWCKVMRLVQNGIKGISRKVIGMMGFDNGHLISRVQRGAMGILLRCDKGSKPEKRLCDEPASERLGGLKESHANEGKIYTTTASVSATQKRIGILGSCTAQGVLS